VVSGGRLDLMTLEAFSNLNDSMILRSSALLQCNRPYDKDYRKWKHIASVPVPCPVQQGCMVPVGPFLLWALAPEISELCGKRKGGERGKWTQCCG